MWALEVHKLVRVGRSIQRRHARVKAQVLAHATDGAQHRPCVEHGDVTRLQADVHLAFLFFCVGPSGGGENLKQCL